MRRTFLVALFLLASCNKEPKPTKAYLSAIKEADTAFRARDAAAEVAALETAAASCIPADCAYTKFRLANSLVEAGRNEEAFAAYREVADKHPKSEEGPKALVKAAKLRESDRVEERALLYEAIKLDPANVAAWRAVDILITHAREKGLPEEVRTEVSRKSCGDSPECAAPKGALAAREECTLLLYSMNSKTELTSLILFRRADLSDELGDSNAALIDEKKIIKKGPSFPQYDDACWRAAQRHIKNNEPEEALKILEELIELRHHSFAMGSVNSQYLDDAVVLAGDLYLQAGKTKEAKEHYEEIFRHYKQSILRDDALWKLANMEALEKEERCEALLRLQKEFSDSRFYKKSLDLNASIPCQ